MIDKPKNVPDTEEETDEEEKKPQESAYKPKRPRNLAVMLGIALLFFILAISGIIVALRATTEDPNEIVFPEHVSKSLAEEQEHPVEDSESAVIPEQSEEVLTETPADEQTEAPVDLNPVTEEKAQPEVAPATDPSVEQDKEETKVGPQSEIHWDKIPAINMNADKAPKIAIVIDDMGLNHRNSVAITQLPATLTLAYLPYADGLPQQTSAAYQKGHELIVHMPMQPDDLAHNNPGPDALLTSNTSEENVRRLNSNLSKFSGYVGLNNHMGSQMTSNPTMMLPIMQAIKEKGLWFLDSKTIGSSVAGKLAGQMNIPYAERDVFLDNVQSVPSVLAQLKQTEAVARKKGYAVAIGHPHTATIEALKQWVPQAEHNGFELVSLTTIIAMRYPRADVPRYAQIKKKEATGIDISRIEPAAGHAMSKPVFGIYPTETKNAIQ